MTSDRTVPNSEYGNPSHSPTVETAGPGAMPRREDYQNRKEYLTAYSREWVRRRRAAFFAGKTCDSCSAVESLQLHHREPERKVSHQIWSWSESRRNAELAKCIVLCEACHLKLTRLDISTRLEPGKPGASGIPNVYWNAKGKLWRVEFRFRGKRVWPGGTGFRNIVTARLAAESFRATLAGIQLKQNIRAKIACRKQYALPLEVSA